MPSFADIKAKTAVLQEQIAKLQAEAAEQVKPLLQQFIFDNPQVEAVRWRQYTPYFNDGDTCEFSVHEPYFKFVGADEGGDYDDGFFTAPDDEVHDGKRGFVATWRNNEFIENGPTLEQCSVETATACQALAKELGGLEDALHSLFGDHVEVTVTKDGVDVEEYEHD